MDFEKTTVHNPWKDLSLLRLFLPMVSGLLFEYCTPSGIVFLLCGFFLSNAAFIFLNGISFQKTYQIRVVFGVLVQISFVFFGMMVMHVHQDKPIIESGYNSQTNKNYLL